MVKLVTISSLLITVVGNSPTVVARVLNAPEPVWLAVWGVALLGLGSTIRHSVGARRPVQQVPSRPRKSDLPRRPMGESLARPA